MDTFKTQEKAKAMQRDLDNAFDPSKIESAMIIKTQKGDIIGEIFNNGYIGMQNGMYSKEEAMFFALAILNYYIGE